MIWFSCLMLLLIINNPQLYCKQQTHRDQQILPIDTLVDTLGHNFESPLEKSISEDKKSKTKDDTPKDQDASDTDPNIQEINIEECDEESDLEFLDENFDELEGLEIDLKELAKYEKPLTFLQNLKLSLTYFKVRAQQAKEYLAEKAGTAKKYISEKSTTAKQHVSQHKKAYLASLASLVTLTSALLYRKYVHKLKPPENG